MQATSGAADDQARVAPPRKYFPPASVVDWVAPDRQLWVGWSIKECRYYRPELECMRCGSTLYANRAVCGRTIDFCMRCHLDKDNNYDPINVYWDPQELARYKTYPIWLLRPEEFVVCPNLGVYQTNASYKLELQQLGFEGRPIPELYNPAAFVELNFLGVFRASEPGVVNHTFVELDNPMDAAASAQVPSHLVGSRGRSATPKARRMGAKYFRCRHSSVRCLRSCGS